MKRHRQFLVLLLFALALPSLAFADEKKEPAQLNGSWKVIKGEPEPDIRRMNFNGDTLTVFFDEDRQKQVKIKVDATAKPARIDFMKGDEVQEAAIYQITGETLRIHVSKGKERPIDFKAGSGTVTFTLMREKMDPPKTAVVDPYDQSKVPLEVEPPADFKGKKIVLVAGKQSHGPGDHEFFAGTAILMNLLKQTKDVWPVMARDGWPKNEKIFEGADSILFYMDGRGGHPVVQGDRMDKIQKLMDKGVGWVNLHYAVDYLPKHGKRVLGWMGGYYEPDYSINPHWDASIRSLPKHPITRGVKPFVLRDEWYYNMRFVEDMKNVTPILVAVPPDNTRGTAAAKMHPGRAEIMAWAYDRPDGGRGFGFTGGHFHRNWADENFRRTVVNAILWSANIDVPEGGAKVEFDPADLNKNLDKKGKGEFKPILPPEKKEPK